MAKHKFACISLTVRDRVTLQKTNAEVIVVTDKVHFIPNMYGVGPYIVVMLYTTVFR